VPAQLILPLTSQPSLSRSDFIVGPGNAPAFALIDRWPNWPVHVVALYGPAGSGKTHLVSIWQSLSGACSLSADMLDQVPPRKGPLAIEDVDSYPPSELRDARLFQLIEGASPESPLLLTGKDAPASWPALLPDLASRFSAVLSLPLWKPDDAMLVRLAHKLLADRQLSVPEGVVARVLQSLERSPEAVREFIARADAKALSEARPITLSLVRELLAETNEGLS
jgi:chromosomal replication initiation ATPase DnaA